MSLARPVLYFVSGPCFVPQMWYFQQLIWTVLRRAGPESRGREERKRAGKFRQKLTTVMTVRSGTGIHTAPYWNVLGCVCLAKSSSFNLLQPLRFRVWLEGLTLLLFQQSFCFKHRPFYGLYWHLKKKKFFLALSKILSHYYPACIL